MPKGISLHLGLNGVNPAKYLGWDGRLNAAQNDAQDMYDLAAKCGFKAQKLLASGVCRDTVIYQIKQTASELKGGDTFLLTYSGHGGQIDDLEGYESDGMNETFCFYDGFILDDELYNLWKQFNKGVRIILFADSCNSGTVAKMNQQSFRTSKVIPPEVSKQMTVSYKSVYQNIKANLAQQNTIGNNEQFSGLLISACQDGFRAFEGVTNGDFTGALLSVWNNGTFTRNYADFHNEISRKLRNQRPNYYPFGNGPDLFSNLPVFTI